MRVNVECGRGFTVDLDDERPIDRRAFVAVTEQVANRLEELERFTARIASIKMAGEAGHTGEPIPERPPGLDQVATLYRLILRAREICGIDTNPPKEGGQA